ncbi:hypothetical protein BD410DRAFT_842821 [Rickenella mellea]|uniref:Uncharacterized protein n=1 Tax=Rickenella mellea TaxID=50990 RepID=A0A4Y7PTV3_9AGAM|nr:hypothetical protein BD410DRAFT_842821 [Rickenella mellea]
MAPKRAQPPTSAAPPNKTAASANKENITTKAATTKAAAKAKKNATRAANPAAMQTFTDAMAAAAANAPQIVVQHAGSAADTTFNNMALTISAAATNPTINTDENATNIVTNANATRAGASVPPIDPTLLVGDVEKLQQELRDAREALAAANVATATANAAAAAAVNPATTTANVTAAANIAPNAPTAMTVANVPDDQAAEVFHPGTGCAGNGFNLQEEMGLAGDDDKYLAIRRALNGIVNQSGLDCKKTWPKQSKIVIARVLLLARQKIPYLRRFHQDWATIEYMRGRFKNQRQYAVRITKKVNSELVADGIGGDELAIGVGAGGGNA